MSPQLQFFIDIDRETLKRITVRPLGHDGFLVAICFQFDRGWETDEETVKIRGKAALARRLIEEGVTEEAAYDDLSMEAPPAPTILTTLGTSAVMWLLLAVVGVTAYAWL